MAVHFYPYWNFPLVFTRLSKNEFQDLGRQVNKRIDSDDFNHCGKCYCPGSHQAAI
jgi:hypothetical protein